MKILKIFSQGLLTIKIFSQGIRDYVFKEDPASQAACRRYLLLNFSALSMINHYSTPQLYHDYYSQEADLPLAFGLGLQRRIRPPPSLDFSQVLPLIRV